MREEKGTTYVVNEGDIDTVHDEGHPRGLWQLGKIEGLVCGADGVVRGVRVRVMSKKGHPKTLRRPLQHIYPLEVRCEPTEGERAGVEPDQDEAPDRHDHPSLTPMETAEPSTSSSVSRRPTRRAAAQASDRILVCAIEFEDSCDCVRSHSTGGVCGLLGIYCTGPVIHLSIYQTILLYRHHFSLSCVVCKFWARTISIESK